MSKVLCNSKNPPTCRFHGVKSVETQVKSVLNSEYAFKLVQETEANTSSITDYNTFAEYKGNLIASERLYEASPIGLKKLSDTIDNSKSSAQEKFEAKVKLKDAYKKREEILSQNEKISKTFEAYETTLENNKIGETITLTPKGSDKDKEALRAIGRIQPGTAVAIKTHSGDIIYDYAVSEPTDTKKGFFEKISPAYFYTDYDTKKDDFETGGGYVRRALRLGSGVDLEINNVKEVTPIKDTVIKNGINESLKISPAETSKDTYGIYGIEGKNFYYQMNGESKKNDSDYFLVDGADRIYIRKEKITNVITA